MSDEPTTVEVLQKARALIADPKRWTHSYYARDEQGYDVEPNEPSACCWCAFGAVLAVEDLESGDEADSDAANALVRVALAEGTSVPFVNDIDGHDAVLALLDKAIAAEAGR